MENQTKRTTNDARKFFDEMEEKMEKLDSKRSKLIKNYLFIALKYIRPRLLK